MVRTEFERIREVRKRMTLKELLEWAEKNDCLDCDVCVQYRDDGGLYYGRDYDIQPTLEGKPSGKIVVVL